jgi:hypothetical protein
MTFTSVDFPAPFSPIRAVTSPGYKSTCTLFNALTPGKTLLMPFKDKSGVVSDITLFSGITSGGQLETGSAAFRIRIF